MICSPFLYLLLWPFTWLLFCDLILCSFCITFFSFEENNIVTRSLICLPIKANGLFFIPKFWCIVGYQGFSCRLRKIWTLESVLSENFLSSIRITLGQPEKVSTCIKKSPTPLMYSWSICTRLHDSTSFGHEFKVVCVKKFLIFYIFLASFYIYSSISREYPSHHASVILFVFALLHSVYNHVHFIIDFVCVSGWITRALLEITPCSIVNLCLIFCRVFPPWKNFPTLFSYYRYYST